MFGDTWGVTPANVNDLTGETPSANTVAVAGEMVNIYSNRTQAASGSMTPRDFGWIQRAVAYQAAWVTHQLALFARNQTAELAQDDMRTTAHDGNNTWREWTITLAPMAARALKNLSWKTRRADSSGYRVRTTWAAANDPYFLREDGSW